MKRGYTDRIRQTTLAIIGLLAVMGNGSLMAEIYQDGNVYTFDSDYYAGEKPVSMNVSSVFRGVSETFGYLYWLTIPDFQLNADLTIGDGSPYMKASFAIEGYQMLINGARRLTLNTDLSVLSPILSSKKGSSLSVNGPGILGLYSNNRYDGGTTISQASSVWVFDGGTVGTGKVNTSGVLGFNMYENFTLANPISGTGQLQIFGGSTFTITGANAHTGGTVIDTGTVVMGNAKALGTGSLVLQGGTLDLNGNNYVVNGEFYSVFGTNVTSTGSRPTTLTINASTDSAVRAVISDGQTASGKPATVGLVKGGSKYLFMLSESTYTGSTVVNAGVLQIGEGGTYGSIASSSLVNNSSVIFYRADALTYNGNISGKGSIRHSGAGPLTLGGASTYTGGTLIDTGSTLIAGSAKALGASTGDLFLSGTLDLNGYNLTIGQLYDKNLGSTPQITNNGANLAILTTNTKINGKFDGQISDGFGRLALVKAGTSALFLSGNNSYSGGTTLLAGGLSIDSDTALGSGDFTIAGASSIDNNSGAAVTLTNNNVQKWNANFFFNGKNDLNLGSGAVTMNGSRVITVNAKTLTVGGGISAPNGAFGLTKLGKGTLVLGGDSTYSGPTVVSAGTLQIGEGGTTGSIASASLVNNGVVEFNRGDFLSYGGVISGAGSLVKNGSGELLLWGANKYTGGTAINDGQVVLGNATALGSAGGALTINSGLLDLNGYNTTVGTLSGNGTIISTSVVPPPSGGSGGVVVIGGGDGGVIYNPNPGSGGVLIISGATATLNPDATLSIGGGQLITASDFKFLFQASGGTLEYNGVLFHSSETIGANRATSSASAYPDSGPVTFTTNSAKSSTFSGNIEGSGVTFVKAGAGILTLSGDNSHGGGTTLLGGGLNINSATALGSGDFKIAGATVIDNTSGGALALTRDNTQTWSSGFTFKGTNDLDLGTGAVVMNAARGVGITVTARKLIVGGSISGAPKIGLTKAGAGTLVLTGNSSYTGATTVSAGTLQIGDGGTSGSLSSNSLVNNSAVVFNRSDASSFNGAISGKGTLSQVGRGSLTLNGTNSYTGGTYIGFESEIVMGTAKALGATTSKLQVDGQLDLNGNNLTVGQLLVADLGFPPGTLFNNRADTTATLTTNTALASEVNGRITDGAGRIALVKAGTGILTLNNNNDHSGGTTLAAGGLNLNRVAALGSGDFKITGAATLDNTSGSALKLITANDQIWSSGFTFKGTNDLNLGTGDVLMNAARGVGITVTAGKLTVGGNISANSATIGLTKTGKGTLVLTGNSSYTGTTTVSAGTLQIGDSEHSGYLASTSLVNSGIVEFVTPTNNTYGGAISGTGSVVKTGDGSLALSGVSKYTGGTTINAGHLIIWNSKALGSATSALTVNASGTLDLNANSLSVGTLSGDGSIISEPPISVPQWRGMQDIVLSGATQPLAPQASPGTGTPITLTVNSAASSTFNGTINAPALTLIKSGVGTLTLGGSNNYGGGTVLNAGGLNINNAKALGSGPLTIAGVSTLDNTSGGAITLANSLPQNWNANFTFKGTNDLNLGNGPVSINGARTVTVTAKKLTVGGDISQVGTKPLGLTKAGAGTLVLTGNSSYTGATTVSAGTLQIGDGGNSGSIASASLVNNGIVAFNRSDSHGYAGAISGKGVVQQNGAGELTLSGVNSHTGGTVLNAGTLLVGSATALGRGVVTLNEGVLGTTGDVSRINIASHLYWDGDAMISLSLDPTGGSELVAVGGKVVMLGDSRLTFDLTVTEVPAASNVSYLLMTVTGGFGNLTSDSFAFTSNSSSLTGGQFRIDAKTKSLYFDAIYSDEVIPAVFQRSVLDSEVSFASIEAVPEPSTWMLIALGGLGLLAWRMKRPGARA